jgi:hypothetical protein
MAGGGVSPLVGGGPARCLSVGGRTARAAAAAPFPRTRHPAVPTVTHSPVTALARAAGPSYPRRAILSPRKLTVIRALPMVASLRFAPRRPWTVTFLGKIRHLPGGQERTGAKRAQAC